MSLPLKYEQEIRAALQRVNYEPRGDQVSYINQIVEAFVDDDYENVVLSAPTGTGKSLIGIVVAEVVQNVKYHGHPLASFVLMQNNNLTKQYHKSFEKTRGVFMVKGAANYPCSVLAEATADPDANAESCVRGAMQKANKDGEFDDALSQCERCEYRRSRAMVNKAQHLITNYSYFFIGKLYAGNLLPRSITVWDEAHTINEVFSEHCAIYISENRLKKTYNEAAENLTLGDAKLFKNLRDITKALVDGKINDDNFGSYLEDLAGIYSAISKEAEREANRKISTSLASYQKLSKLHKKYEGFFCKIDDFFKFGFEHVFEYNPKQKEATVKPIFVKDMFQELSHSDHHLFMSATITEEFMETTLKLDKEKTKFIQLEPTFPPENKAVVFYSPLPLNFNTLKDEKTRQALDAKVKAVVKKHIELGESGIIITPSFDLTERLTIALKGYNVFDHQRGEKLADLLDSFKRETEPAILISPSLFEGIDLPDELSRFQVMVKAPFGSLGEKRMKHICDYYPEVYELYTILKLIQGCGRSVRSPTDWCTTYMLDQNISRLWRSPQNIWRDEFEVKHVSMLM